MEYYAAIKEEQGVSSCSDSLLKEKNNVLPFILQGGGGDGEIVRRRLWILSTLAIEDMGWVQQGD